jgi:hypothetical protein
MKNLFLFLLVCVLSTPLFAQIVELETVEVSPVKYKYIYEVVDDDIDQSVKDLQIKLGEFDVTKEDYYNDEHEGYSVSFFIPEGYAVASYDKNGKLIKTIERYKNVKLPLSINQALVQRYPNWTLDKDIYKVNYSEEKWESKKTYKLKLTNGEKVMRIKMDDEGNFL